MLCAIWEKYILAFSCVENVSVKSNSVRLFGCGPAITKRLRLDNF